MVFLLLKKGFAKKALSAAGIFMLAVLNPLNVLVKVHLYSSYAIAYPAML